MLLCVDEILGVFDHTEACQQVTEMDRNPAFLYTLIYKIMRWSCFG